MPVLGNFSIHHLSEHRSATLDRFIRNKADHNGGGRAGKFETSTYKGLSSLPSALLFKNSCIAARAALFGSSCLKESSQTFMGT